MNELEKDFFSMVEIVACLCFSFEDFLLKVARFHSNTFPSVQHIHSTNSTDDERADILDELQKAQKLNKIVYEYASRNVTLVNIFFQVST